MTFTRSGIRIVYSVAAVLSLTALGDGSATAKPAPAVTDGSLIPVTIKDRSTFTGTIDCRNQADGVHPYLVLDDDAHGNDRRIGRNTTYHTGDGKNLHFGEYVLAGAGIPSFGDFNSAYVQVNLAGHNSHGRLTLYCASTLEEAHQK